MNFSLNTLSVFFALTEKFNLTEEASLDRLSGGGNQIMNRNAA